jgi:hypothetical protein
MKRTLFFACAFLGILAGIFFVPQSRTESKPHDHKDPIDTNNDSGPPEPTPTATPSTTPMIVEKADGRLSLGAITFDKKSREIVIPAAVNMCEGAVEYLLVNRSGKVHESVFVTDVTAHDLHVAALLLGMKPEADLGPNRSTAVIRGKGAVVIAVEWDRNGPPERIFLNETVKLSDPATGLSSGTLAAGAWLYNGSRIETNGVFAATRSGSIISIIRDDDALINNPGITRDDDEIHTPNAEKLPAKDHPVRIILQIR